MSWDGIRHTIWTKGLDEMECIGNTDFSVGVPIEADPEFKAMVYAAEVTHSQGNTSIDYVYRNHSKKWIEDFDPENLHPAGSITELLLKLRSAAVGRAAALSAMTLHASTPVGSFFAANALIRLQSTFQASLQLINVGFAFEAESVIRLGFEQVSWAFAIGQMNDIQDVMKKKPTSSIVALKQYFPGAGAIYGRLSEQAHISPKVHGRYVSVDTDSLQVNLRCPEFASESALMLIILLDAYLVISESLYSQSGIVRENSSDTGDIRENRYCARLLEEYVTALPADARDVFSQWQASNFSALRADGFE